MKDTLTPFNRDDFRQRYKNNYGFLTLPTGRRLVYIKDVTADRVSFTTDDDGDVYYAHAGAGVMFDFLPIVRGWYPTQDAAVFITRVPARQYHRGISHNNTYVCKPQWGQLTTVELSLALLSQLFETPASYSFKDFEDGVVDYFILGKAFCLQGGSTYFFNQRIGVYEPSSRTIILETTLVQQEINDVIRRLNVPLVVKVQDDNS